MLSEILKYLKKHGEATLDQIAMSLKADRSFVKMALDELIARGRVRQQVVKHTTCGGCGGACCVAGCVEMEVFCYVDRG